MSHTHTYTHTHTYAGTHTHAHTHTYTRTHAHTRVLASWAVAMDLDQQRKTWSWACDRRGSIEAKSWPRRHTVINTALQSGCFHGLPFHPQRSQKRPSFEEKIYSTAANAALQTIAYDLVPHETVVTYATPLCLLLLPISTQQVHVSEEGRKTKRPKYDK